MLAVKDRRGKNVYGPLEGSTAQRLDAAAVSTATGGNQPHDNMQPSLVLNFVIALFGIFPSPLFDFAAHAGHAIAGIF